MNKVYCDNCNWIGDADEVLKARCEMVFDDPVDVCPDCNYPESIAPLNSLSRKRQIDQKREEISI